MELADVVDYMAKLGEGVVDSIGEVTDKDALDYLAGVAGFNWVEVNEVAKTIVGADLDHLAMVKYALRSIEMNAAAVEEGVPGASVSYALAVLIAYDFLRKGIAIGCVYTRENIREMNEALDVKPPDDPRTS